MEPGLQRLKQLDILLGDVQAALDAMRPFVENASHIGPGEFQGFLSVVLRAVLRRQFDSLEAISHLVAAGRGHAAPTLLRPSCEELIWISYLVTIPEKEAEKLIRCKAVSEVRELLKAQRADGGQAAMEELGLLRYYKRSEESKEAVRAQIRALGETLAWPPDTRKEGQPPRFPSVLWLAKRTGRKDIYDCIYGATSRFVHFSAQGLLRLAWYKPGSMSVRSEHFRDYGGAFSLQWGFRLFSESAIELSKAPGMPDEWLNETGLLSIVKRVAAFGKVPVITAEELAVPE